MSTPKNEDASISGIAPVAPTQGVLLKPAFPKTAFGGGEEPDNYAPAKRKKTSEDSEYELAALLGL